MEDRRLGRNHSLDGKQIHHSCFVEGTLDMVNAGLSAYHLAEQTTGIHKMTFGLIDANNNIRTWHRLLASSAGERPVTPDSYRRNRSIRSNDNNDCTGYL